MALDGPAGSGKTYTALAIAKHLGDRVALIDTEHASASKYADTFTFDTLALQSFHPQQYIDAIHAAEQAGYDVLIIDSLSHAWAGKDGALELVDRAAKKSGNGNKYVAWGDVTPLQNQLIDTILAARLHVIATLRTKTEYALEPDARGKQVPRKIGLAPVQRDGVEYEFDIVGDLDADHNLTISKTRCAALDGVMLNKPGENLAQTVKAWLTDGAPVTAPPTQWTRDPAEWAKFAAVAKEHGLSQQAVKDILQVQSFHDFTGTREQATALLVAFTKETGHAKV